MQNYNGVQVCWHKLNGGWQWHSYSLIILSFLDYMHVALFGKKVFTGKIQCIESHKRCYVPTEKCTLRESDVNASESTQLIV